MLQTFNTDYTTLLQDLDEAWAGDQSALSSAIGKMFSLKNTADELMKTPLPNGSGSYGPEFRITD